MTNQALHEIDQKHYLPTFKRYPIALDHGKGSRVWDVEGKEYIDLLAGIAVSNIGHAHPTLVNAIEEQAAKLIHISNFYVSEPQMKLVEKLAQLSGLERAFMANSGAEAAEGAIKIARKYGHKAGRGGTIIAMKNAFHGRTLATVAATGKEAMMNGFDPIPSGFKHVPFNDIEALKEAITDDVGGIMLEPIQGEGGINPADSDYLRQVRAICDKKNIALIFDEIQCGIGRTGTMFAFEHYGIKPDIMTLAKGLGGGVPVGAVLAREKVAQAIDWGDHGTTFGGNPLACAAALAVLEVIESENLLQKATESGAWLKGKINALRSELPEIELIRGAGLMLGIQVSMDPKAIVGTMLKKGVLANATAGNIVRLVPPLNIDRESLEEALEIFIESIKENRK
ncbi:acetylornithine transaminase [Marinoscillum sp. MHG1-6]|uniref:acetylornithine transaminase n=1 Tax=Marinoscillum sp. MHG1-6 TaxID=2959627 RepID=UPI00215866DF|nr:acetylornithine transaminase [Marinoscillum sp. MHG1-6]